MVSTNANTIVPFNETNCVKRVVVILALNYGQLLLLLVLEKMDHFALFMLGTSISPRLLHIINNII